MNIFIRTAFLIAAGLVMPTLAAASGYGVFTQGASGLGQANAVVAHTTGPSSIYFNPALINDVPGRQIEVGTTAVYSDREIDYTGGGSENGDSAWNFPSTFYYTHQANDKLTSGLGIFFPFGLSNEWDDNYEGRYIGTSGEMLTMNINPAVSYRVTDRLSLAVGLDFVYLDTEIKANVNQTVAGGLLPPILGGPLAELLPDVRQKFSGDGWGAGYNLGILFKATDRVSIGAAYRSKVKIDVEGDMSLYGVDPRMQLLFQEGNAESDIQLPAQFTVGVATQVTDALLIEVGARWEDWDVNDTQTLELQNPILGETRIVQNRNWHSTWSYNIGANYKLNDNLALNCGYLYGENAVPNETFEPIIPDSDAHLFTIGTDLKKDAWTLSAAFGYEYHEERTKNNAVGDPVGSLAAGFPVGTANGDYNTDIYLFALSLGYAF
jgi:long-chain fatty acid transport protein